MPRFAVLIHDHPFLHWDFLLEAGGSARTWRLLRSPDTPGPIPAEALPDHRLDYLDYEGPVSRNRGEVRRWDRGEYTTRHQTAERVEVRLDGRKLNGPFVFEATDAAGNWVFRRTDES